MNKKAFTLIEVIIAISLLSIVIVTVLKIKENNFSNIIKLNEINTNAQLLGIASSRLNINEDTNKHFYMNKILEVKNDDFNKILKNNKVYVKSEIINTRKIENKIIKTIKTNYKIENKISTDIYTFKVEDN